MGLELGDGVIGTAIIVPLVGLVHAMVLGGTALVAMLLVAFFGLHRRGKLPSHVAYRLQ